MRLMAIVMGAVSLGLAACSVGVGPPAPTDDDNLIVHQPRQSPGDHGFDGNYYLGELRLDEDGCIQLGVDGMPVIVWPSSDYAVEIVDGEANVVDQDSGGLIARVGDEVVVDGTILTPGLEVNRSRLTAAIEEPFPEACAEKGELFMMGQHLEVAPDTDTRATPEPPVVHNDELTVYFPRQVPFGDRPIDDGAPIRELVLDDDGCLRAGENGPVIIWPYAGYTVDIVEGDVALVSTDSDRVIAYVGDEISLHGAEPGYGSHVPSDMYWHEAPDACDSEAGYYATGPGVRRARDVGETIRDSGSARPSR